MMTSSIFRLIEYDLEQPPVPAAPQDDTNTQREEMDGSFIDIDVGYGLSGSSSTSSEHAGRPWPRSNSSPAAKGALWPVVASATKIITG